MDIQKGLVSSLFVLGLNGILKLLIIRRGSVKPVAER